MPTYFSTKVPSPGRTRKKCVKAQQVKLSITLPVFKC